MKSQFCWIKGTHIHYLREAEGDVTQRHVDREVNNLGRGGVHDIGVGKKRVVTIPCHDWVLVHVQDCFIGHC